MVTAIILMNAERGAIATVGEQLAEIPEISEVYSVGGRYDLVAMIRVKENEDLAELVTQRLPDIQGIVSTETLLSFRAYSRHDLENLFSIGM